MSFASKKKISPKKILGFTEKKKKTVWVFSLVDRQQCWPLLISFCKTEPVSCVDSKSGHVSRVSEHAAQNSMFQTAFNRAWNWKKKYIQKDKKKKGKIQMANFSFGGCHNQFYRRMNIVLLYEDRKKIWISESSWIFKIVIDILLFVGF